MAKIIFRIFFITCFGLQCLKAFAVEPASLLIPSPLSLILAYNSYTKDQKKVFYIRVQSQAVDFEQAKKQAFRLASEQVAGTVVLSESELRNSKLTRDEIITYSSGLIDEYKIVDRFDSPGYVKLTVDIWITESVMAQRLLAKSATDKKIYGDALATRVESILEERQGADAIFRAVLRDFPKRSFRVTVVQMGISMDADRNTHVLVNVKIEWDERFVKAFEDAAQKTGRKRCWINCGWERFFIQGYEFDDKQTIKSVGDELYKGYPLVALIELQNTYTQAVKRQCIHVNYYNDPIFFTYSENVLYLISSKTHWIYADFNINKDTATMAKLENIRIEIVPQAQCQPL